MEYIVHGVAKSWTRLSNFHFHSPACVWEETLEEWKVKKSMAASSQPVLLS